MFHVAYLLFALFLRRKGNLECEVTGSRKFSSDLPQGGLEIPCKWIFKGIARDISKVKKLFAAADLPYNVYGNHQESGETVTSIKLSDTKVESLAKKNPNF